MFLGIGYETAVQAFAGMGRVRENGRDQTRGTGFSGDHGQPPPPQEINDWPRLLGECPLDTSYRKLFSKRAMCSRCGFLLHDSTPQMLVMTFRASISQGWPSLKGISSRFTVGVS